ncbi:hypothetical protein ACQY0O_006001 [Thecaphora frezii]
MGRITEITSDDAAGPSSGAGAGRGEGEMLTSAEREQILFESGVIEKLGLPKDFITLEEAQKQLDALNMSKSRPHSKPSRRSTQPRSSESRATRSNGADSPDGTKERGETQSYPEWTADTDSDATSSDDYGQPSDREDASDDDAEKLMRDQEEREMSPGVESALDVVIWTMPFGFLFTLLDVLVRQQYGETVGFAEEAARLVASIPLLGAFIWYNLTSKRIVMLQVLLFAIFSVCTPALIYIVNKSSYDVVVRRVPPLGTLCVFAAVRLELLPTCVGLALIAAYIQWFDMKIVFS